MNKIICFIFIIVLCTTAQYTGGADDGFGSLKSNLTFMDGTERTVFSRGGNSDGFSKNNSHSVSLDGLRVDDKYSGGNNDGYLLTSFGVSTLDGIELANKFYGGSGSGYVTSINEGIFISGVDFTDVRYNGGVGGGYTFTELGSAEPLPVELTSFSGQLSDESVKLAWETATETNNYGFEIQRRIDSTEGNLNMEEWENIGFVEGHGTSNSPKSYEYLDEDLPLVPKVSYRLKQIDIDGTFGFSKVVEIDISILTSLSNEDKTLEFSLSQNYPNPFNPVTVIKYQIAAKSDVKLDVFNILGQRVKMLVNENQNSGKYKAQFNGEGFASGIYFYRLKTKPI